jgi:multidrug efflux pump subunit AcrB
VRRPYTFIVLALLLPLIGALTIMGTPLRPGMPTDIFPDIKIPVIAVTFQYAGMPPDDMAGRITAQIERYATTVVNDIEHVESRTYPGMAVIKIFFQPGVDITRRPQSRRRARPIIPISVTTRESRTTLK